MVIGRGSLVRRNSGRSQRKYQKICFPDSKLSLSNNNTKAINTNVLIIKRYMFLPTRVTINVTLTLAQRARKIYNGQNPSDAKQKQSPTKPT